MRRNSVKSIEEYGGINLVKLPRFKDALCYETGMDPEAYYPKNERIGRAGKHAKKICDSCLAKEKCLEFALENDEKHGIWGGTTPRERLKIKRKQERDAKTSAPGPGFNGGFNSSTDWRGITAAG